MPRVANRLKLREDGFEITVRSEKLGKMSLRDGTKTISDNIRTEQSIHSKRLPLRQGEGG